MTRGEEVRGRNATEAAPVLASLGANLIWTLLTKVAPSYVFVASEQDSSYMTGQFLHVNRGIIDHQWTERS
jgi:NAD(P)-dependent dehydrogenase (short-subunit alcohol dehydrogenase family)